MSVQCPPPCWYSTQKPILCVSSKPVVHDDQAGRSAGSDTGDNHFCTACRRSFYAECERTTSCPDHAEAATQS